MANCAVRLTAGAMTLMMVMLASARAEPAPAKANRAEAGARALAGPTNAALAYWRAWSAMPPELHRRVVETFDGRDLAWSPGEVLSGELESARGAIESAQRAAGVGACDWGVDQTLGVERELPHLEKLRETSRLFVSDCRRLLDAGRLDEAVDRCEALLRMSLHTRSDLGAQSSAVGQGFALMACDEVKRFVEHAPLTEAHRQRLTAALRPLDGADPFGFGEGVAFEGALLRRYVERRFTGENAGKEFFMAIQRGGEPDAPARELSAMNAHSLRQSVDKVVVYFESVGAAWGEGAARLRELEKKVVEQEYGSLGVLVCPGYAGACEASAHARVRIQEAIGLLALPARSAAELKPLPKREGVPAGPPPP